MAESAFASMNYTPYVQLGGPGDPCTWSNMVTSGIINSNSNIFGGLYSYIGTASVTIYTADGTPDNNLLACLGFPGSAQISWMTA